MPKKLDYRAVWMDARALLAVHKEAIAAIAGFFIFMSAWISAFLMPPLIVENLDDRNQAILEISRYFEANWRVLVPTMLVTIYGSLSLYVLMSGRSLEKVGDALKIAAALFFPYLLASLLVGWATLAGFLMLIIPGLYLSGRFAILPAVITQDVGGGVRSSVIRSWRVTHNCGWSILFLMLFVAVYFAYFCRCGRCRNRRHLPIHRWRGRRPDCRVRRQGVVCGHRGRCVHSDARRCQPTAFRADT